MKTLTSYIAARPWLRKALVSTPAVRELAWRYVAGEDLDAGLRVARALAGRGLACTLNPVGTHVRTPEAAAAGLESALEAAEAVAREGLDTQLSIKPTRLGLDVDAQLCRRHLRTLLARASALGVFVRLDMEESQYVDVTLDLFEELRGQVGPEAVGVAIQSYLRGRPGDLPRLLASGARVRLVKGGYWEPPSVVWRRRADVDRAFRRDLDLLLAEGTHPAVATHDAAAVAHARAVATARGLDPNAFEFELLHGVQPALAEALAREGHRVRLYVPYGADWYAYFLGCVRRAPRGLVMHTAALLHLADRLGSSS